MPSGFESSFNLVIKAPNFIVTASDFDPALLKESKVRQSSKSRLLMCFIGKTQLLCMQCRGNGPNLVARVGCSERTALK